METGSVVAAVTGTGDDPGFVTATGNGIGDVSVTFCVPLGVVVTDAFDAEEQPMCPVTGPPLESAVRTTRNPNNPVLAMAPAYCPNVVIDPLPTEVAVAHCTEAGVVNAFGSLDACGTSVCPVPELSTTTEATEQFVRFSTALDCPAAERENAMEFGTAVFCA